MKVVDRAPSSGLHAVIEGHMRWMGRLLLYAVVVSAVSRVIYPIPVMQELRELTSPQGWLVGVSLVVLLSGGFWASLRLPARTWWLSVSLIGAVVSVALVALLVFSHGGF